MLFLRSECLFSRGYLMGQSGRAPVADGELYFAVEGSGYPLLLIYAGVADLRMWDEQAAVFKDRFRVIRYDTRGFGKSISQVTSFSNRDDVRALLHHLGVVGTVRIRAGYRPVLGRLVGRGSASERFPHLRRHRPGSAWRIAHKALGAH